MISHDASFIFFQRSLKSTKQFDCTCERCAPMAPDKVRVGRKTLRRQLSGGCRCLQRLSLWQVRRLRCPWPRAVRWRVCAARVL